jgi:hypothetical protein
VANVPFPDKDSIADAISDYVEIFYNARPLPYSRVARVGILCSNEDADQVFLIRKLLNLN